MTMEPIRLGNIYNESFGNSFAGNVWSTQGVIPSLTTCQGGGREPIIPIATSGKQIDVASTILAGYERTNMTGFNSDNAVLEGGTNMEEEKQTYRIRKLTPKECFRLMGVRDEDYDKLTVSDTQKYKQAGNSIVVDVLSEIFTNLFVKECKKNRLF